MYDLERSTSLHRAWLPLALLPACYAVFDFSALMSFVQTIERLDLDLRSALLLYETLVGCAFAQLGVLAAWGVLGTGRPIARWSSGLLAASLLLGVLVTGDSLGELDDPQLRDFFRLLQALPLAYLGVQTPIWAMSLGLGFRIVVAGAAAQTPQRFTLRGLFFATVVVATALGLLQTGAWAGSRDDAFSAIAFCALGGPAWSLLTVAPCLLFALGTNSPVRGAAYLMTYVVALALALRGAHLASGGAAPLSELLSVFAVVGGPTALTLFGSFLVLRHFGYELRRIQPGTSGPSA